jgi:opacity protein-like surface antigen
MKEWFFMKLQRFNLVAGCLLAFGVTQTLPASASQQVAQTGNAGAAGGGKERLNCGPKPCNCKKDCHCQKNCGCQHKGGGLSSIERAERELSDLSARMQRTAEELRGLRVGQHAIGRPETLFGMSSRRVHFYVGLGGSYLSLNTKDKVTSNSRTLTWNEQKIDYYSFVSSIFSKVKRDDDGNIVYGSDGYPEYEKVPEPMDDPEIQAFYHITRDVNGNIVESELKNADQMNAESELKLLLAKKVRNFLGYDSNDPTYGDSLKMVTDGNPVVEGERAAFIRNTTVYLGNLIYSPEKDGGCYFGKRQTANDDLKYNTDGIATIQNLMLRNLVFTNKVVGLGETDGEGGLVPNYGGAVTFSQVIGDAIEQERGGIVTTTMAGQKGMYCNLYSERYMENGSDVFSKTAELAAIDYQVKSHKPTFGGTFFLGVGTTAGRAHLALELGVGFCSVKDRIIRSDQKTTLQTDFVNGNIQYINKNDTIKNPVTGKDYEDGKVYDPATKKVRPIHVSGFGRQAGVDPLNLPDFDRGYDLWIKKNIVFTATPIIGFSHVNSVYYAAFGFSVNKFKVDIVPNNAIGSQYGNALPTAYMKGYMENLKGDTFLHKYVKRLNESGEYITVDSVSSEENARSNHKMEATHPSAVQETNDKGEVNVFSGLRINYPHYDDGGVSVVNETNGAVDEKRPWTDEVLLKNASEKTSFKKNLVVFTPGVGVKTFITPNVFIDARFSYSFGKSFRVENKAFAAYPAHHGRSGEKHDISVREIEVRLAFGVAI